MQSVSVGRNTVHPLFTGILHSAQPQTKICMPVYRNNETKTPSWTSTHYNAHHERLHPSCTQSVPSPSLRQEAGEHPEQDQQAEKQFPPCNRQTAELQLHLIHLDSLRKTASCNNLCRCRMMGFKLFGKLL